VENTESHQIIEEFMLAANEAVAEMLVDNGLLFLRRIHGDPDPRKLAALTEFVRELGLPCESLESRFELQRLLKKLDGDPRQHAVNFAVLRSMQRAVYGPEQEGHYALASENYCHFTSPIRRYPDLTVHRLLELVTHGDKPRQDEPALFRLGDHCSDREQRATAAERELTKVKLLNYLADKLGMQMDGIVTGVESFGLFVQGIELPAEGLVHVSSLANDYYRFDRRSHTISGYRAGHAYRLGDALRVEVVSVDVERRELDFRVIKHLGAPSPGERKRARKARKKDKSPRKRRRK
jgi:ribonuclease R